MITALLLLLAVCPLHEQHMAEARHDTFGFSHESSKHAFRLFDDGGAIELRATKESDAATIAAIRKHLQSIASEFTKSDFSTPHFVHDKTPAGVATMQRLTNAIQYRYEELPAGARVRIRTTDAEALKAVQDFLRWQIAEHQTGDSGNVERDQN
ncbi:MAG TPA: hypothetical protein VLV78_10880 [Thermoanaerobaculia bacterium]|nr:hypothetical protein [Thermoanaerobaculia bacterium]